MRPRRFSAHATPAQAARRARWADYQATGAWLRRRARWLASGHANRDCPGCGLTLDPHHGDVHHLAYPPIPGTEADDDLVLICRGCHEAVHASLDASPAWRSMNRREATWSILTALHARPHPEPTPKETP